MAKNIQHIILFASRKIKTGPEKTRDAGKESALGNKARKKNNFHFLPSEFIIHWASCMKEGEGGKWRMATTPRVGYHLHHAVCPFPSLANSPPLVHHAKTVFCSVRWKLICSRAKRKSLWSPKKWFHLQCDANGCHLYPPFSSTRTLFLNWSYILYDDHSINFRKIPYINTTGWRAKWHKICAVWHFSWLDDRKTLRIFYSDCNKSDTFAILFVHGSYAQYLPLGRRPRNKMLPAFRVRRGVPPPPPSPSTSPSASAPVRSHN